MADEESTPASKEGGSSSPLASLATFVLTSIGIPSLLVVIGYVIDSAQEQFLGVGVHDFDPKQYAQIAGQFLFDVATFVFFLVIHHVIRVVLALVLLCLLIMLIPRIERWKAGRKLRFSLPSLLVVMVVLISIGKIAYFDVPILGINRVLFERLDLTKMGLVAAPPQPSSSTPLRSRLQEHSDYVLGLVFCSHDANAKLPCPGSAEEAENQLQGSFLANLACVLLLVFLARIALTRKNRQKEASGPDAPDDERSLAWTVLVVGLLVIDVFGLLYMYGKTFPASDFEEGEVTYQALDAAARGSATDFQTIPGKALRGSRSGKDMPREPGVSSAPSHEPAGARSQTSNASSSDFETMSGQALPGSKSQTTPGHNEGPGAEAAGKITAQDQGGLSTKSAIVLSSSGDEYVFIDKEDQTIWHVPKSRIVRVILTGTKDILTYHIDTSVHGGAFH